MNHLAIWLEVLALMNAPADLPPPRVVIDQVNNYRRGEIHVRVDECFAISFAHEASHHIAVETGMLAGVPNERVKERLEEIAEDVERRWPEWSPNCEGRVCEPSNTARSSPSASQSPAPLFKEA